MPNLLMDALISSYGYYYALLAHTTTEPNRTNLLNLLEKLKRRIEG